MRRGFVACSECLQPVPIAGPDDKKAGVMCLECADGLRDDGKCVEFTQLPAEVTLEPETPFDNERADMKYREDMKDAGRGHLLR